MKPTSSHVLLAGVDGTEAVDAVLTASVGVGDVASSLCRMPAYPIGVTADLADVNVDGSETFQRGPTLLIADASIEPAIAQLQTK